VVIYRIILGPINSSFLALNPKGGIKAIKRKFRTTDLCAFDWLFDFSATKIAAVW
jgi:hypothetical protein